MYDINEEVSAGPEGELIKNLLLPTPPRTCRRRAGRQLKTWTATIKADLEPLSSELAQDRRAWRRGQHNW